MHETYCNNYTESNNRKVSFSSISEARGSSRILTTINEKKKMTKDDEIKHT